jgi:membrane protein implicated in regulation of membrane protease activity
MDRGKLIRVIGLVAAFVLAAVLAFLFIGFRFGVTFLMCSFLIWWYRVGQKKLMRRGTDSEPSPPIDSKTGVGAKLAVGGSYPNPLPEWLLFVFFFALVAVGHSLGLPGWLVILLSTVVILSICFVWVVRARRRMRPPEKR